MIVIPAIDIKEKRCVRLIKGDPNQETVYSDSPVEQAKQWEGLGAKLLHIVDLDGAFNGTPINLSIIEQIRKETTIEIQIGGGIRDISTVQHYYDIGIHRIILGSAAYEDRELLKEACRKFKDKIIVGIDVVDNFVAIHGWKDITDTHFYDFASEVKSYGIKELIITDINKDGMLSGINLDFYKEALENTKLSIIASGGISGINDIKKLLPLSKIGLKGAITGKALYEKKLDLQEANEIAHAG